MEPFEEPSLDSKRAFFTELNGLDQSDDSGDDLTLEREGLQHRKWRDALSNKTQPSRSRKETIKPAKPPPEQTQGAASRLRDNATAPAAPALTNPPEEVAVERTPLAEIHRRCKRKNSPTIDKETHSDEVIPDSTRPPLRPISLERSASTPNPLTHYTHQPQQEPSPSNRAMAKKRKSDLATVKLVPEARRIFSGLKFYYIPSNDIAPARRRRIRKALEHGAEWTKDVAIATHVVVDKGLTWDSIESTTPGLKQAAMATGSREVVITDENYPLECIQYRVMLNPKQNQYRVPGCPDFLSDKAQPASSAESATSEQSLQLKPPQNNPKRWDYVPPPGTPPREEETPGKSDNKDAESAEAARQQASEDVLPLASLESDNRTEQVHTSTGNAASATSSRPNDDLSHCISQMMQFRDLPLEELEDDGQTSAGGKLEAASEGDRTEDEDEQRHKRRKVTATRSSPPTNGRKDIAWEDRFACNKGGTKDDPADQNPNARTIEILQQMGEYYDRVQDTWRPNAYRKAIATLKRQPKKITTSKEAHKLPSIGKSIADKIEEIVNTDRLRRLENAEDEPLSDVLQMFLKIYGVGYTQASRWVNSGYRTLDDLKEKAKLSTNQLLGIEHYDDLNTRIPRREVQLLGEVVKTTAARVDPELELIIGGSYRRGSDSSGDIDFIVTKKGTLTTSDLLPVLQELVSVLEKDGFLVARLASSRTQDGSKWHGCCILPPEQARKLNGDDDENKENGRPPIWRRIDFLVVPESEIGAALIYFTGNEIFNRSIRLLASKKGMRLNQSGLYKDVMRGPMRAKVTDGELLEGRDEKKIFEILGVQWREPHERWC